MQKRHCILHTALFPSCSGPSAMQLPTTAFLLWFGTAAFSSLGVARWCFQPSACKVWSGCTLLLLKGLSNSHNLLTAGQTHRLLLPSHQTCSLATLDQFSSAARFIASPRLPLNESVLHPCLLRVAFCFPHLPK